MRREGKMQGGMRQRASCEIKMKARRKCGKIHGEKMQVDKDA